MSALRRRSPSLRQRLGRSGRRGQPAVLRMYETERGIDAKTHPVDALRLRLVRSIAMVELLLDRWCERPRPDALHLSTLLHHPGRIPGDVQRPAARHHSHHRTAGAGNDDRLFRAAVERRGRPRPRKVVLVKPSAGGRPPPFTGDFGLIDDRIVRRMRAVLGRNDTPRCLDAEAAELLEEGRATYRQLELSRRRIVDLGEGHYLLAAWDGTVRTATLALARISRRNARRLS